MMGFLKFLGGWALAIIGVLGMLGGFMSCVNVGILSSMSNENVSNTPFIIAFIISFIIFLGGIYVLRKH